MADGPRTRIETSAMARSEHYRDREREEGWDWTVSVPLLLMVLGLLYVAVHVNDLQKKCRDAGGIPSGVTCYRPEALIEIPGWEIKK